MTEILEGSVSTWNAEGLG
uniref:Uncharacterized protein n=1 Tax=Anguilla anguilla TaxID=7936 RepID=A0A0E9Q7B9_ANGAN